MSIAHAPVHIEVGLTRMVGSGFTVTVTIAVPVQPTALVPVTVYEVVTVGQGEMLAPVTPVLQL